MSTNYISQITATDGVTYDVQEGVTTRIFRATCTTAASTAAKVATLDDATGYSLTAGVRIAVTFTYGNTATSPTLNVNSGGAKNIYYRIDASTYEIVDELCVWGNNETVIFTYNGTIWTMMGSSLALYNAYNKAASHAHGNITNGGDITATAPTIANGDQIIINDNSASKITNGPTFDGYTTTKALTPKGTWETFSSTDTKVTQTVDNTTNSQFSMVFSPSNSTATEELKKTSRLNWSPTSSTLTIADKSIGSSSISRVEINPIGVSLYNSNDYYARIALTSGRTSSDTLYLPNKNGTIALTSDIPTKTSDLTNDSGFITTDTKNTAGSTESTSKIYLIGATSQTDYSQTYSNSKVFISSDKKLYSPYIYSIEGDVTTNHYSLLEHQEDLIKFRSEAPGNNGVYLEVNYNSGSPYVSISGKSSASLTEYIKINYNGSVKITGLSSPSSNTDAATKKYVDDSIGDRIPTEATVSGWGFTKNTGTLTGVTFAGTLMSVSNGVASISSANARTALGLATVATSGSYNDLTNKPTIPTNTDEKLAISEANLNVGYNVLLGNGESAQTRQGDGGLWYTRISGTPAIANLCVGNGTHSSGNLTLGDGTSHSTTITTDTQTANRTITLPDKTGTVALTSDIPDVSSFITVDEKVKQENTTSSSTYRVLLSGNANDTTSTTTSYKSTNLKFTPSTGNLQTTQINGVTVGSSPKFTDSEVSTLTLASGSTTGTSLSFGSKYTLTAGSKTVSFTMPSSPTVTQANINASSSSLEFEFTGDIYTTNNLDDETDALYTEIVATQTSMENITTVVNSKPNITITRW